MLPNTDVYGRLRNERLSVLRDGTGSYGTASKYNVDPVRLWKVYQGIVLIHGDDVLSTGSVRLGQWLS